MDVNHDSHSPESVVSVQGETVAQLRARLLEAERERNDFLARLAHDLRNGLAPLSNALQVWPLVKHNAAERDHLHTLMQRQILEMGRLIDDLSEVSQPHRTHARLRPQPVDVNTVVTAVVDSLEPFIEACGHRWTMTVPQQPVIVAGDVALLSDIVSGVVQNMAKFTAPNGTLCVLVERRGPQAIISVKEQRAREASAGDLSPILEMFRQAERSVDRSEEEFGVGLAPIKRLAELHGGTIEAHNEGIGKGSEIVVSLPATANGAPGCTTCDPDPVEKRDHVPSHRILVVDDVEACAITLAMMLRAINQDVDAVYDGSAAVQAALATKPDFVFLDIAMPEMDGYEVARQLRAVPALQGTRLVALTGYGQENDRRKSLAAGFDHHLTKPANLELIRNLLGTATNR